MKLFNMSLVATVFGQSPTDDRKVPPRTPEQRLNFLNLQMESWITDNVCAKRPIRCSNMDDNVKTQVTGKIHTAFVDRKCSSWSTEWKPHGGPDPNGPMGNVAWKDHRKTLVQLLSQRVADGKSKKKIQSQKRRRRDVKRIRRDINLIDSDVFDNYFIQAAQDGERSAGIEFDRMVQTMADQEKRLYAILVGYMKWSWRYLSNCPNDAADTHAVKIYDFVEHSLIDVYNILNSEE